MDDAERGYLAAMLDGEGSIDWNRDNPRIRVANGWRPLLCSLETSYGGSVNSEPTFRSDGLKRKPAYRWTLTGERAVDVLVSVRSLLRVKGDIADEVVHKWRTRGREKLRTARAAAAARPVEAGASEIESTSRILAQLQSETLPARAMLIEAMPEDDRVHHPQCYQQFKADVVAKFDHDRWSYGLDDVRAWYAAWLRTPASELVERGWLTSRQ